MELRVAVKCRIQAILHRQGILHDFSDLFGKQGRQFLKSLKFPAASRCVLDGWLKLQDDVVQRLTEVEDWMEQTLEVDPIVRILSTIPGLGLILAHVIRAEVGQLDEIAWIRLLVPDRLGVAIGLDRPFVPSPGQ